MVNRRHNHGVPLRALSIALGALGFAAAAQAGNFSLDNGIEGNWTLGASVGTSWRAKNADPALIGFNNGGTGNPGADDGELNYGKGKIFTTTGKIVGDLQLKKDNFGIFVRGKAWYDYTGKHQKVPHGSAANNYTPDTPLDDSEFDTLSKFSGAQVMDAYAFGTFNLTETTPLAIKLGNQVVNWGESTFIGGGINQYGVVDVPAARRPGAQLKEILLPIPQVHASLGLPADLTLEAFHELKWKRTVLDGCGTFFSFADILNCRRYSMPFDALGGPDSMGWNGYTAGPFAGANGQLSLLPDRKPSDNGQFGVSLKYYAKPIETEFGAYFVNYHANTPSFTLHRTPTTIPGSIWAGALGVPLSAQWDYSAENIKVLGLSASTVIANWSVFGEVSHTRGLPVGLHGPDMVNAMFGAGPLASRLTGAAGEVLTGYDRKNKTQLNLSTLKLFPNVIGADTLVLLGEVGFQNWSGIGDSFTGVRYGRGGAPGTGPHATFGGTCPPPAQANQALYCEDKGFATPNAWGYRLFLELSYPNVVAGVNLKPRLFWSHDVKGYSADGVFSQGRQSAGLGLRADYNIKYFVDFSFNAFNKSAKYDTQHDRDFFSLVAGINF